MRASKQPDPLVLEGHIDIHHARKILDITKDGQKISGNLSAVNGMDSAIALLLWNHWGQRIPTTAVLSDQQQRLFSLLQGVSPGDDRIAPEALKHDYIKENFERWGTDLKGLLATFGQLLLDFFYLLRNPTAVPAREISAACYRTGATGLPITTIVGFLIGIVLSYLSSLSLKDFGAESFLPLVLGIGVLRELGPLLTAIVLAGRSGSAITAGLAAMRLTQELDALSALGVSQSLRLVLPRTIALILMTPLLTVCTNVAALFGGYVAGSVELHISSEAFLLGLRHDVPLSDMYIGLFKALVFGGAIAIIACYYGLSARPNTQSLATNTTRSVVLSISLIILLDALFAVLFKDI